MVQKESHESRWRAAKPEAGRWQGEEKILSKPVKRAPLTEEGGTGRGGNNPFPSGEGHPLSVIGLKGKGEGRGH